MPEQTSLVLAGCQQLVLVDGELLGDPMERAALQALQGDVDEMQGDIGEI